MNRAIASAVCCLLLATVPLAYGAPKPGQASLDVDTPGCPTTFEAPACEARTAWSVSATTGTPTLVDPDGTAYGFEVTVTEGATTNYLLGSSEVVVTNSGDLPGQLSSVVVMLEQRNFTNSGDAPGPSGKNWDIVASAVANEAAACTDLGVARTCYGELSADGSSFVVLRDSNSNDVIALVDVLPIPPTSDNDGDGLRDEDEVDGVDNDGDGATDEDGACQDAVRFTVEYEFDLSALGLVGPGDPADPTDNLRVDMIVTFGSAGRRGGSGASCTADINCNGVIDADNAGTINVDESESRNIRSVQQRLEFDLPACVPVCASVTLESAGALSLDESCAAVTTSGLIDQGGIDQGGSVVIASAGQGATTTFSIEGTVTCGVGDCGTCVTAEATLSGGGCNDLIMGSPAPATFAVECAGDAPEIRPGDFCTLSLTDWGFSLLVRDFERDSVLQLSRWRDRW